ncbi:MAG: TetR family transcriptional regulator [Xenophilus sp.]
MPSARKRPILLAACEAFASFSLASARIDRIAERAEVNKRLIYCHRSVV